ncbi:MAG: carbohydrate ABC transporter permease [Firmicutes bacterium]|nr:carbohydrate ABC transporter permease [Bacillota bacterium]
MKARCKQDALFDFINFLYIIAMIVIFAFPLIFIFCASISDQNAVWQGKVWLWPVGPSFAGYKRIFEYKDIWLGYRNTIVYTLSGTLLNVIMTICAAYPISRKDFKAGPALTTFYLATMFFNAGIIPNYLLIKSLGLLDSFWVMILPGAVGVWNVIVTRTFFRSNIPNELREAAAIDGCSNFRLLIKIILPLSSAILAILTLFYGVSHWNAYFNALLYLKTRTRFPLQLILREILIINTSLIDPESLSGSASERQTIVESIKYGVIIVSSLPLLIAYPFVQKHFVKGIMVGSLKG